MPRLTPLVCLLALAGCRPAEDVRTYTVPKPTDAPAAAAEPDGATDRVLGALIPAPDGRFYSIKLLGPIAAVSTQADTFRAFVESVRLTGDPTKPLTYSVPVGWRETGGANGFRLATFKVGDGPKALEPYIAAPAGGSLLDNVNRWREQVGAKKIAESELAAVASDLKLGDATARYVDARGKGGPGGMAAPFLQKK